MQKLYLTLEETVAGTIQKFEENSNIAKSINYLIKCLINIQMISETNEIINNRLVLIYEKMNTAMIHKLNAAPLSPR